ncbi:MAG: HAMP domain-containing protein, partial [Syntrophobacterales bacterium]|nr:HAMP domain-containing protein [Syntrophobacterales bacterium]
MKIASKISLSFLILIVLFTSILIPVFYTIATDNLKGSIYSNLKEVAQSRASAVEIFLDSGKESIRQLSESITIKKFLLADKTASNYRQRSEDVIQRLRSTANIMKYTYGVFILDRNGIVVASSEPAEIGANKSSDPYFLEGKKGAFIKDAYMSDTKKAASIAFSAPVYGESDINWLGVVVSRMRMTAINDILKKKTGLGETGEMYLINRNGYMITPSRFMKDTFLRLKVDTENSRKALKQFTGPQAAKYMEHKPSVFIDYKGVSALGAHALIPEMHWCLLAEIDESEVLAPLEKLASLFMIIFLLIPLTAWPAGRFVARIITKPLHKLHEGTEEIEKGNLDYKVGTDAKDEIGQLSRAFDEMTEHLKETTTSIDDLNKEIDERRRAEEALQKSEATFRAISAAANDGIIMMNNEGEVTYWNEAAEKILGYTGEDILG